MLTGIEIIKSEINSIVNSGYEILAVTAYKPRCWLFVTKTKILGISYYYPQLYQYDAFRIELSEIISVSYKPGLTFLSSSCLRFNYSTTIGIFYKEIFFYGAIMRTLSRGYYTPIGPWKKPGEIYKLLAKIVDDRKFPTHFCDQR